MANTPIQFPPINGVNGFTCGVYSFGWTSGCTDDYGVDRGFTQDWYYDGKLGAWVSSTQTTREYPDVNILGNDVSMLVHYGYTASFSIYDIHFLGIQDVSSGIYGITLELANPPLSNKYGEITLIVDNPSAPFFFDIIGKDVLGNDGIVHMDRSLTSSDPDGLTSGIHMWKIWTIDGGQNYHMYRPNGYSRFWDA